MDPVSKYKSHTHREHIYKIPDTYIGSVELNTSNSWKIEDDKMVRTELTHIPGLYKIVDEVIVNAWDQYIRCQSDDVKVTHIAITVDPKSGIVSVENDGRGIDVLMHPEHNIYTVELIFGKLLTSTNYTEGEERVTGGKNGYGAKLANIFSNWFEVETVDLRTGKKFIQKFSKNMEIREEPRITNIGNKVKEYTKISFMPDFERFGLENWTPDMIEIFKRRAYEVAACCGEKLKVTFNGEVVPIRKFKSFCEMYYDTKDSIVHEKCGPRWDVAVGLSDEFKHVSFVNGIYTTKGGKHVDHVVQLISKKMAEMILKKEKVNVKSSYIREHMFVFVNCLIVNPSFDSQTKDFLTTQVTKFGSSCTFTDKFYDSLVKLGLIERVIETYQFKESKLMKKTDGKKKSKLYGIPKLDDANEAGGKRSSECTLILTEGDSAKAMAVAGLSVVGRDLYGVFPLRGKVINARDKITTKAGKTQVMNNVELVHMKQILGLEQDVKYKDISKLRYGHIMIMTDQDYDGSHIKGLIINWLDTFWPELLKIQGFVQCMQTPIVKLSNKKQEISFYSIRKYEEWKDENPTCSNWKAKYYKGLGTSTTVEAKEYFKNMMKQEYTWDISAINSIDMAFNRDRSDDRKSWLGSHDPSQILGEEKLVSFSDFVNKELIHFSNYDLFRSIPNIMDGLKPSQRKILYSCFKRKLKNEIRVAQLAGYVSEHSGYHHGEESLNNAIIAMAQNFTGSNNVHLLEPSGQFGTRLMGGKDAGSPRYLHTALSDVAYKIFNTDDNEILKYRDDDGTPVEPEYYAPIIPYILCNGSHGIGTGYSTSIPSFNPIDIIDYIKDKINNKNTPDLVPYYHGFNGKIRVIESQIWTKGRYEILNYKTILITELPIGTWIDTYKTFIDDIVSDIVTPAKLVKGAPTTSTEWNGIKNYRSQSTESRPHFEIEVDPDVLSDWLQKAAADKKSGAFVDYIEKKFKLVSKISLSNMHLYSVNGNVKKYNTCHDIIDEYYQCRLHLYTDRKEHLLSKIKKDMTILENKVRFIELVVSDKLDIRKHTKQTLRDILSSLEFMTDDADSFNYLINLPMYQMTTDMVTNLQTTFESKRGEYEHLSTLETKSMWLSDLDDLKVSLNSQMINTTNSFDQITPIIKKVRVKKISKE
jgi:DNA topoisomerase-2